MSGRSKYESMYENTDLCLLIKKYLAMTQHDERSAEHCINFMPAQITDSLCRLVETKTRLWYSHRFGRITASKLYEASKFNFS